MLENLRIIHESHDWLFQVWFFSVGACVGSFLNVCILRIPEGKSIVTPRSHCACGTLIAWYDNIPILSWFILRGRARCCGRSFSFRYALIEAITAGVFLALWIWLPPVRAVAGMLFFCLLLLGSMIDLDHMVLPDISTLGGMCAGLVLSFIFPDIQHISRTGWWVSDDMRSFGFALIGVLIGTGVVFWMRELGEFFLKKEAMGYGDILLMGCIGAFCGWRGAVFAIFGGAVIGCAFILPWMIFARLTQKPSGETPSVPAPMPELDAPPASAPVVAQSTEATKGDVPLEAVPSAPAFGVAIPFGPWLALGGFLYYAWLYPQVNAYFEMVRDIVSGVPRQF